MLDAIQKKFKESLDRAQEQNRKGCGETNCYSYARRCEVGVHIAGCYSCSRNYKDKYKPNAGAIAR